jgi:hypothetical protein
MHYTTQVAPEKSNSRIELASQLSTLGDKIIEQLARFVAYLRPGKNLILIYMGDPEN